MSAHYVAEREAVASITTASRAMTCAHCNGAGWVKSVRPGFIVDRCNPCRGSGMPDAPAPPPRRLGLRERTSYAIVRWLCARRTARP